MSHDCPNCGDFLTGRSCDTCGYDKLNDDRGRGFAFDGGFPENSLEAHLHSALDASDDLEVNYHIRSALQYLALREGDVGWGGTYGPANGGVVD